MSDRKIVSELMSEMVKTKLYGEENTGTTVTGHKSFIVKADCSNSESEDSFPQEFTVQASSPEEAKRRAMEMSKEMNYTSCKIKDVEMVPNSDEELNNYGNGSATNLDPEAMAGQVKPSAVSSDLPDVDA